MPTMHRITAALLIVAAVFALNGGMLRDAFAKDMSVQLPPAKIGASGPLETRSTRVLNLILALQALQAEPSVLVPQKG
jgi:hypothetical protein